MAALLCLAAGGAQAQGRTGFVLAPSASIGQTLTDSHEPEGGGPRHAESITSIGAGLKLAGRSGRVEGSLDYSLTGLIHARDTRANELQNRLQASLLGELMPRLVYFEAQAAISQQPISAVRGPSVNGAGARSNLTEVSVLSLRPSFRARIAGEIDAEASLAWTATDTGQDAASAQASNSVNGSASLSLASATGRRLGWSFIATRSVADFKTGRRTEDDRLTASLRFSPDIDWQFRVRGGMEANDYRTAEKERFNTWGAGLEWTPSPRTRMSLDGDKRAFGHSHVASLQHRSRRTTWRYTDGQDLSRGSAETAQSLVGAYDLFFELFAAQEPDPEKRAELVDSLLQRNGLTRESRVAAGFLTSAVTVSRRQEASLAIAAQRSTWLLSAFSNRTERVDTVSGGLDETSGGTTVRQRGLTVTVTHRLTTTGSVNLNASMVRSSQSAGPRTELRSVTGGWTERLGPRTNFTLLVRHTEYDAALEPYSENAVIANLTLRF